MKLRFLAPILPLSLLLAGASSALAQETPAPGFSKSFSPNPVNSGGRTTLTYTIDNSANASPLSGLAFNDVLPPGIVIAGPANASSDCDSPTITALPGTDTIQFNALSIAASATCTVSVDVIGQGVGVLNSVSSPLAYTPFGTFDSQFGGTASAMLTVTRDDLLLTKSFTDDPVAPGDTVTLEYTITNFSRTAAATNIAFTDDLDTALSGLAAVGLPANDVCGAGSQLSGTGVLSFTGGSLPPGGSCTFSVTLQVPAAAGNGAYPSTSSNITGDVDGNPVTGAPASEDLHVSTAPTLTKEFIDDPVAAGGQVTLRFTITNDDPGSALTDIAFTDDLNTAIPEGGLAANSLVSGEAAVPMLDVCGVGSMLTVEDPPDIDFGGGNIIVIPADPTMLIFTGGSLAPAGQAGDSCSFDVVLDVLPGTAGGEYLNTTSPITALSGDEEPVVGAPATGGLIVVDSPRLTKEFIDDPVQPGDTATLRFTLTYGDEGTVGDATGIAFTDDLDAVLSGLVATGLPISACGGTLSTPDGGSTLSFSGGTVTPGSPCSFDVPVQVPAGALSGRYTNTTSEVSATVDGLAVTGVPATDELVVTELLFTKEFIDDPVMPGETATLRFTLSNLSPVDDVAGISFTDDLENVLPGLVAVLPPTPDPPCGAGSSLTGTSLLTFSGGSLNPGETCSFDVTVQVPVDAEDADHFNATSEFSVFIGQFELTLPPATDTLTVALPVPPAFSKSFAPDTIGVGEVSTLTFTIDNTASLFEASEIDFTDNLPAGVVIADPTNASSTCSGGMGDASPGAGSFSYSGGVVPAGTSCTVQFNITAAAAGMFVNTTGDLTSSSGNSGTATDTLTVIAGSIGDFVFEDHNGDGVQDPGEPGVGGVTVELLDGGGLVMDSTPTLPDGSYDFENLPAGNYSARLVLPAGAFLTTSATVPVTLGPGEDFADADFGVIYAGAVHGFKFEDVDANGLYDPGVDSPLPGVQFTLTGIDIFGAPVGPLLVETNLSGECWFVVLVPGDYTVTETVPAGHVATTPTIANLRIASREALVWQDGAAMLPPESGPFREVNVGTTLMFGNTVPGSIHGYVFNDLNANGLDDGEPRIEDVIITLTGIDGMGNAVNGGTTSDADGRYDLTGLIPGDYTITETVPDNGTATTPTSVNRTVFSRQELVWTDGAAELEPGDPRVEILDGGLGFGVQLAVDLAVTITESSDLVAAGSGLPGNLTHTVRVTNNGPSDATGVALSVAQMLPPGVTADSITPSAGTSFADPTWTVGDLANGAFATLEIVMSIPATVPGIADGISTTSATSASDQPDLDDTNDSATETSSIISPASMGIEVIDDDPVLNLQSGLFDQRVRITNNNPLPISGFRLLSNNLPVDVTLYNGQGDVGGIPFVDFGDPLAPGESIVLELEYFRANLDGDFDPQYEVAEVFVDDPVDPPAGPGGVVLDPPVILDNGDRMIEFSAIPGNEYAVEYSDNGTDWNRVVPSIVAPANQVQWIDSGPPKTASHPSGVPMRLYRIVSLTP